MSALLETAGARPQKEAKFVPLFMDRTFTGLYTQRSVLHDPSDVVTSRFYGGRPDALWMGSNVELTNRLTLQRRPGLSPFSTTTYPTAPDRGFSFQLTDGTIQVIIDTGSTGSIAIDEVTEVSGVAFYFFSTPQPLAASNGYAGLTFNITGFDQQPNNGAYVCASSTANYIVLNNPSAVDETFAASAVSSGAVYYDQQNGSKTLLFSKLPGAGQSYFVAVAGVLYVGDGVSNWLYTPGGLNGTVWNWGGTAPVNPPGVTIVESGSAAISWVADTVFSTMGLLLDSNGHVEFLTGVNSTGNNTTQLGTTGNGQPLWDDTIGSITVDNTCNWTNWGPISLWTAGTTFTYEQPIFDPVTGWIFQSSGGKSGNARPVFNPTINTHTNDANGMLWAAVGKAAAWLPNFTYHAWWEHNICIVCQPIVPTATNLTPKTGTILQPIFLQSNNDQTTGSKDDPGISGSGYSPAWPDQAGQTTTDGDLLWVDLGTATWAADTDYFAWSAGSTSFSVVRDPTGDFQVCITSGASASLTPYTQWQPTHVYSPGSTIAVRFGAGTFMLFTTTAGGTSGSPTSTNPSGQPTWDFTTSSTTTDNTVTWVASGTTVTNVWGNTYGSTTSDGTVTWTNVGPSINWAASTQWYLPKAGFAPPTSSQPYGGAQIVGNGFVQVVTATGKSGSTQPIWPSSAQTYTLTAVANSIDQTAVYTGTIVAPAGSLDGFIFEVTGFVTNPSNNGTGFTAVDNNGTTTLTLTNPNAVAESASATATCTILNSNVTDGTVNWFTESLYSQNTLAFSFGYAYAYSYESRLATDPFNTVAPPGIANPLGTPTGNETGGITTASPATVIVGSNPGAVLTITGIGPVDSQYDTIVIWRSADGGGSSNMFFLTEFNAPKPIQGQAQPWKFVDTLPDTPTATEPGLNNLIPAPIDDENDAPPKGFLPQVYNFQRIWGSVGTSVFFSGGPDVITGNPNQAFNPADEFPFLAPVVRLVKTSQGLITFLTDSVEIIAGGPLTSSFYSVTVSPGIGLGSYNGLDVYAGEIFFVSADSQMKVMSPSLSLSNAGFPIGDKIALLDATKVYLAVQEAGVDNCIMLADGSTGWYRLNPRQVPGINQPEPIWSPFANITNGCQMVQSIEVSAGIKKLLVGSTTGGNPILERNLNVFTDNGTEYGAFFVMGSIVLAHPGQLAILAFLEMDFSGVNYQPTISYLLNEIAGIFTPFVNGVNGVPQFDPPSLYGTTISPTSYSPNRYYFASNASLARCRHMQIKVDLGMTPNGDEIYNLTIYGRLNIER